MASEIAPFRGGVRSSPQRPASIRTIFGRFAFAALLLLLAATPLPAREIEPEVSVRVGGPAMEPAVAPRVTLAAAAWLGDPNTRVVLLGTALLGVSAGIVGVFLILRRQALVGDVVGHATLPGIAIAFLVLESIAPGSGKSTAGLLTGAFLSGLAGAGVMLFLERKTSLKPDAIQAVVLSVFYGLGAALLSVIQQIPSGNSAGLKDYLNGKTATLLASDVMLFAGVAVGLLVVTLLLFKELTLVSFDDEFAAAGGWPVGWLNTLLMLLVVGITVLGLQSVGLILVVAALIIPAAAARFWTNEVHHMAIISAAIGGASAVLGVLASNAIPRMAAGAAIVLSAGLLFLISFAFGAERGLVLRSIRRRRLVQRMERQHLLRGLYEILERTGQQGAVPSPLVSWESAAELRSWSRGRLGQLFRWGEREGYLTLASAGVSLSESGVAEGARLVRNHRLWELFMMQYADMAAERVDRDADEIEHVLDADLIRELEARLTPLQPGNLPPSPH